jgi:hypothetical protein
MWNIVQQISVDVAASSEASLENPTLKNRTLPDGFRAAEACVEPSPSKTAVPVAMLVWKFTIFRHLDIPLDNPDLVGLLYPLIRLNDCDLRLL